ncbi:MAG TPA: HD domain-containing phosphohydrolase [Acidimicrobiia bacterium]|nr:HD domain-containing phosphohydrolase [Acidimicrobiia bacterium]
MTLDSNAPGERWRPRRLAAFAVRAIAFLAPLAVGFLAARTVGSLLEPPIGVSGVIGWWGAVIGAATLASHLTDRVSRRLLPLSVLLNLSLAFPDRTPSRFGVALRSGNVGQLKQRLEQATQEGQTDLAEATEVILALVAAISQHDRRTRGHAERTRAYTDLLATEMALPSDDRDKLRWAALLHDIGKLSVPAEILNKPSRLTEDEFATVKQHPVEGMRLIAPIREWLGPWALTIEHHHERWDGSGYPAGLAGTEISLGARIVSVADAYDVMVSGRSYQQRLSHSEARAEVARNSGTQFDPRVVRALMELSIGRLRWITGPLGGLADLPFIRPLQALGRDVATVVTAGAVTIAAGSGLIPVSGLSLLPDRAGPPVNHTVGIDSGDEGTAAAGPGGPTAQGPGNALSSTTTSVVVTTTTAAPTTTVSPTTTTLAATTPSTTATTPPTTPPTTTVSTTTTAAGSLVANDDQASTRPSEKINIGVLDNDSGAYDRATLQVVQGPSSGSAEVKASGRIHYSADANFTGTVTLTYRICTAGGSCDTATVIVTVA